MKDKTNDKQKHNGENKPPKSPTDSPPVREPHPEKPKKYLVG